MTTTWILAAAMAGCGSSTPLDLGPDRDAHGGDADADADSDVDSDADSDGDGGTSCDELCDRLDECNIGDDRDCEINCPTVRDALSPEAWETIYGDCSREPCDAIERCVEEAPSEVEPQPYQVRFCEDACDRIVACNLDEGGGRDCMDQCLRSDGDIPVNLLSREVVAELTDCLGGACNDLEECFQQVADSWDVDP